MIQPERGVVSSAQPTSRVALLVRNAAHNLVRAAASSLVSVLLPLVLLALLPHQEYAAWALVFSLAAYVLYLDFGIPTTVQAIVGRSEGSNDPRSALDAEYAGLKVVALLGALCIAAAFAASVSLHSLFPSVPNQLIGEAQVALVIVTIGQLSNLVANTSSAYFAGQQRSHIPTSIVAPSRLLSMALSVGGAILTHNLTLIALCYAVPLFAGTAILLLRFWAEARASLGGQIGRSSVDTALGVKYLLSYSGPLIVWNMSMLLISGVGLTLVARLDYSAVVSYSFATILVTALSGADSALIAPLLPELGRSHSSAGMDRVASLAKKATALNSVFLMSAVSGLILLVPTLIHILAPTASANLPKAFVITSLLVFSGALRLSMTPVSLAFIATKRHHKVIAPPLTEAFSTLVLSVIFGGLWGAMGVAASALIGACIGVILTLTWSLHLTQIAGFLRLRLFMIGVLRPVLATLPALIAATSVQVMGTSGSLFGLVLSLIGLACTALLMWKVALDADTRSELIARIRPRLRTRRRQRLGA